MSLLVYNPGLVVADTSRLDLGTYIIASNVLTISAWVKYPQTARTSDVIISTNGKGSTSNVIRLQCAERRAEMRVNSATGNANSELVGNDNQWTHVCGILNGSSFRAAFINGGGKGINTDTQNSSSTVAGCIGGNNNTDSGFNGLIAEVAVWNSVLTDNDVLLLSKGLKPSDLKFSNLIYYAPMKMGDGNRIHFRSTKTQTYTFVGVGIKPRLCLDHPQMIERKKFTPLLGFIPASGLASRTFDANITQDSDTLTSTATISTAATASITQDNDTLVSTGTIASAFASSITQDADTLVSTLDVTVSGLNLVAAITQDADTLTSTATLSLAAVSAITQASDTLSSTGTLSISALASITQASDSISSTGAISTAFNASITQDADSISSTFTIDSNSLSFVCNITQDSDTVSSSATVSVSGTAGITQASDTLSSSTVWAVVGQASNTQDNQSVSASVGVVLSLVSTFTQELDALVSTAVTLIGVEAKEIYRIRAPMMAVKGDYSTMIQSYGGRSIMVSKLERKSEIAR